MLTGDFNAHIGENKAGATPDQRSIQSSQHGYRVLGHRYSKCTCETDARGKSMLRQLANWDMMVLNGRTERDVIGRSTFKWNSRDGGGIKGSVLDYAIVSNKMSADFGVFDVWDSTVMNHSATIAWVHVSGNGATLDSDSS